MAGSSGLITLRTEENAQASVAKNSLQGDMEMSASVGTKKSGRDGTEQAARDGAKNDANDIVPGELWRSVGKS